MSPSFTGDPYSHWWRHTMVVFDVETTGLNPIDGGDRIVEVGFARFENGDLVDQWGSLVNPGVPIPEEAAAIHGISNDDVKDAPRFFECLPNILNICRSAYPVAYNAEFDRMFWDAELGRLPLCRPQLPIFNPAILWFDPIVWIRQKDGIWAGNKLTEVCERYGVDLLNAHSAVDDCTATGRLIYAALTEVLPPVTMTELVRRQQVYHQRHDDERRAWFEKKGIPYT